MQTWTTWLCTHVLFNVNSFNIPVHKFSQRKSFDLVFGTVPSAVYLLFFHYDDLQILPAVIQLRVLPVLCFTVDSGI